MKKFQKDLFQFLKKLVEGKKLRIYPSKKEIFDVESFKNIIKARLTSMLKEIPNLKIRFAGSTEKETFVSGSYDIDIYIISDDFEEAYKNISSMFFLGKEKIGQLKIWNSIVDGFEVDFVCLSPKLEKREDTLKHAVFFKEQLSKGMKNEVIKAKAYLKTKGLYGAEQGSIVGVALEELIRKYKTFKKVCKTLSFSTKKPFIQDPTIEKKRDLLASISLKRWSQLQTVFSKYILLPRFQYQIMTWEGFMKKYDDYCTIFFKRNGNAGFDFDNIVSCGTHSQNILFNTESREVAINFDVFVDNDRIVMVYKIYPHELSESKEVCLDLTKVKTKDVKAFKKAKDWYKKGECVCAMVKRKIRFPDSFFTNEVNKRAMKKGFKKL